MEHSAAFKKDIFTRFLGTIHQCKSQIKEPQSRNKQNNQIKSVYHSSITLFGGRVIDGLTGNQKVLAGPVGVGGEV